MTISGIQPAQNVYTNPFVQESSNRSSAPSIVRNTEADTVKISEEAMKLAQKDQAEKNQGNIAAGQTEASTPDGGLPLEAFALPSWYGDYHPEALNLTTTLNYDFFDMVGELTKDNSMSDEDRSQIKNYLQNDPMHQEKLEKDSFRKQFKDELSEYTELKGNYFREALEENGIVSSTDYYEKVILDKDNSEKIHQSFKIRIESDPRALELMGTLGIKPNS